MSTPVTYAPAKQFVGIAPEAVQGTPVAMTTTPLVTDFKANDKPTFLKDQAWRGSMGTDSFGQILGVGIAEISSIGGPVFGDTIGFFLRNILGDVATTGTPTGSGSTTLSALVAAGATSITTVASIPAATVIQIGTGATAECFTTGTPTGAGPYTIPLATPTGGLKYAHASAQAVVPVTGPYTYAFSLLNSGTGQPTSHTLTHSLGPTAVSGARQYPGFCLAQLGLKFNVESELLTWSGQGVSWPSVALGAAPVAAPGNVVPVASWRTKVGIGGPASGGTLVNTVAEGEVTIKREVTPMFTATGVQTPYIIQRGGLSAAGTIVFAPVPDEAALIYMLNNTQPSVQVLVDNGLVGTNKITVQIDLGQAAFTSSAANAEKAAVGYDNSYEAVFNTANAGGSGGMSPVKVSVTCNVTPGTF